MADTFLMQVLGWDLETCTDEAKIELESLPESYHDATHWATAPSNHILEEFRATLHQQIDDKGSFDCIVAFEANLVGGKIKPKDEGSLKAVRGTISKVRRSSLDATNDGGAFCGAEGGGSLHGAVGVFVKGGNRASSILGLKAQPHFLCRVRCPPYEIDSACIHVSVDFVPSLEAVLAFLADVGVGWNLYVLNVTTIPVLRMLEALDAQRSSAFVNDELLTYSSSGGRGHSQVTSTVATEASVLYAERNAHQQAAIRRAVTMSPRLQIIHGPPGTGKTATLVALIESLLGDESNRVYASAPTNQAICELAKRCLQGMVLQPGSSRRVPMHEMVLVGNASRLVLDDEVAMIHLDSRAELVDTAIKAIWQTMQDGASATPEIVAGAQPSAATDVLARILHTSSQLAKHAMILANGLPPEFLSDGSRQELSRRALELARRCNAASPARRETLEAFAASCPEEIVTSLLTFVQDRRWQLPPSGLSTDTLKDASLRGARLVFSTVSTAARRDMVDVRSGGFNVAIIDEATQLPEAGTAMMLSPAVQCLVLAGDNKQLPSTVISMRAEKAGFGRSLFDRALSKGCPSSLLRTQYRMRPEISAWPNETFYEGRLIDGENVTSSVYDRFFHDTVPPISFVDVPGTETKGVDGSLHNGMEVDVAMGIVNAVCKLAQAAKRAAGGAFAPTKVGIITPYAAQRHELTQRAERGRFDPTAMEVVCRTVDGFQGQECDIIIFSAVRTQGMGFLKDDRRLNVAITRAKYSLVVLGDRRNLTKNCRWRSLIDHIVRSGSGSFPFFADLVSKAERRYLTEEKDLQAMRISPCFFRDTLWGGRVLLKDAFLRSIVKVPDVGTRERVLCVLTSLAGGRWKRYGSVGAGTGDLLEGIVYTVPMQRYELVWSVHLSERLETAPRAAAGSRQGTVWTQVLQVWDFVSPHDLVRLKGSIRKVLTRLSPEYIARLRERSSDNGPLRWVYNDGFRANAVESAIPSSTDGGEDAEVGPSLSLMKNYDLDDSVRNMILHADPGSITAELLHSLSADETRLVQSLGVSNIVMGRSGTGKTTVMLQRLFTYATVYAERQQQLLAAGDGENGECDGTDAAAATSAPAPAAPATRDVPSYPQMLVTASPILATAVRRNYGNLAATKSRFTPASPVPFLENVSFDVRLDKYPPDGFPLIVTYSDFLCMVDRTLEVPFMEPLGPARGGPRTLVDFQRFATFYYRELGDVHDARGVVRSADELFKEFVGVIKGSLAAVKSPGGRLDREQYVALAELRGSSLNADERHHVYDLFERAEHLRATMAPNEYDLSDFVGHLYRALAARPYRGLKMCAIYVDEVQDLTPSQIALLKFFCDDLSGFFFAGDTAQTIAHGVGFRFETLKDIFYSEFIGARKNASVPEIVQLRQNFRTHAGVLALANSVVKLILKFFPATIDKLEDEESIVAGPKPVFLQDTEDVVSALFSKGEMNYEFGAEQAILVGDDATKHRVKALCGDSALVLTVVEAKGMEFNDILIYNFFSSGHVGMAWRVILGAFGDFRLPLPAGLGVPQFDAKKHAGLCVELKKLYVLLTRAKRHLFIFEENKDVREPMRLLWSAMEAVEHKCMDEEVRKSLATTADPPEVWARRGEEFVARGAWDNARQCFHRAGDRVKEGRCVAKLLAIKAEAEHFARPHTAATDALFLEAAAAYEKPPVEDVLEAAVCTQKGRAYERAAELFTRVGEWARAAECWWEGKKWLRAAEAFRAPVLQLWRRAATCYEQLKSWSAAADMYAADGDLQSALKACKEGRLYRHGLALCDQAIPRASVMGSGIASSSDPEALRKDFVRVAADHFAAVGNVEEAVFFLRLQSKKDCVQYLVRRKLFGMLAKIHEDDGEFAEAVRFLEASGDYRRACDCYVKMGLSDAAVKCALRSHRLALLDKSFSALQRLTAQDHAYIKSLIPFQVQETPSMAAVMKDVRLELKVLHDPIADLASPRNAVEVLKSVAESASTGVCHRLVLTLTRTVLHGIANNRTRQNRLPVSWPLLSVMLDELNVACRVFLRCLETTLPLVQEGMSVSKADRQLLDDCFDFFAVSAGVGKQLSLCLEDIPATAALWHETAVTNAKSAAAQPAPKGKTGGAQSLFQQRRSVTVGDFRTKATAFLQKVVEDAAALRALEIKDRLGDFTKFGLVERYLGYAKLPPPLPPPGRNRPAAVVPTDPAEMDGLNSMLMLAYRNPPPSNKAAGDRAEADRRQWLSRMTACVVAAVFSPFGSLWDGGSADVAADLAADHRLEKGLRSEVLTEKGASWSFERVARALLYSEHLPADKAAVLVTEVKKNVIGAVSHRLGQQGVTIAQRDARMEEDCSMMLCAAFLWLLPAATKRRGAHTPASGGAEETVNPEWESLRKGANYLVMSYTEKDRPLYLAEGCLSPNTFLSLLEKHFVPIFLLTDSAKGVLMPASLARAVHRRHGRFFRPYLAAESVPDARESTAKSLLNKIVEMLLEILVLDVNGKDGLVDWLKASGAIPQKQQSLALITVRMLRIVLAGMCSLRANVQTGRFIVALRKAVRVGFRNLLEHMPQPLTVYLSHISDRSSTINRSNYATMCRDMGDRLLYVLPEGTKPVRNKDIKTLIDYVNVVGDGADGTRLEPMSQEAATAHMNKMDAEGFAMVGRGRMLPQKRAASTANVRPVGSAAGSLPGPAEVVPPAPRVDSGAVSEEVAAEDDGVDGPLMSEAELAVQLLAGSGAAPVVALRHQGVMVLEYLEGRVRRLARAARLRVKQRSAYDSFAITMLRELEKAHGIKGGEPYAKAFSEGSGAAGTREGQGSLLRELYNLRTEIDRLQARADARERAGEGVDDALLDRLDALREWQQKALPGDACHAERDVDMLAELAWQLVAAIGP